MNIRRLCVYCGSSVGNRTEFIAQARLLGKALAEQNVGLVFGGGQIGLMGAVADACLEHGGEVIGVIPEKLATTEVSHTGCTELHVVAAMHARKALMADMSDAFAALPGGIGTFEELFEVATWRQIGYHDKPVFVVNVDGFYDPMIALLEETERDGFLRLKGATNGQFIEFVDDVDDLLARLGLAETSSVERR